MKPIIRPLWGYDGPMVARFTALVVLCTTLVTGCSAPAWPGDDAGSGPPTVPDLSGDLKHCPASQCSIGGRCWAAGQRPASGSCRLCDPKLSPISWAPAPGCVVTLAGDPRFNMHRDGKVIDALFNRPVAVALGPGGELWISDAFSHRLRRIKAGVVSSHGIKMYGLGGLAVDSSGVVYVADSFTHTVSRLDGSLMFHAGGFHAGHQDGRLNVAQFLSPRAVALSAGMLFVADFGNNRVRLIDGDKVSTVTGSEAGHKDGDQFAARFSGPSGIFADASGIYVTETGNNTVRLIKGGKVTTLAGNKLMGHRDGWASDARFRDPWGVVHDGAGVVYVADAGNNCIRKIDTKKVKATVSTLTGSLSAAHKDGPLDKALFSSPRGLAMDGKYIYVADELNNAIRVIGR